MSYPRDLDDYTDLELNEEIRRRTVARQNGLCDYCGRTPDTPPCRYRSRHVPDASVTQKTR